MAERARATRSQEASKAPAVARESDEQLAARAATDAEAFAELYRRYVGPIRRYCGFQLRDWWAVEDVTSEIFVQALERLGKTPVTNVRPWLFTIAHHRLTDRYRKQAREVNLGEDVEVLSAAAGPEEAAIARSEVEELRWAITQLKPNQARVVELRLSGLDGPEIRTVLNRSRAWVDTTQYRALHALRGLLNAAERPGDR